MLLKHKFLTGTSKAPFFRPFFWALYGFAIALLYVEFHIDLTIPITIPSILGTAISLFLGFRTNSAYQRWWEARKIWGEIINNSRTVARQILLFGNKDGEALRKLMVQRQIGWCWSLAYNLRELDGKTELEKHLLKDEFQQILKAQNITNTLLFNQEKDAKKLNEIGAINDFDFRKIDSSIKDLCDSMGKSERIKKTVFPTQYSLFTLVFINMFLLLLPLGIVGSLGYYLVPIIVAIGFTFGMIQNIAESMQNPFDNKANDVPLFAMCRTIERDLLEMTGEPNLPEPIKAERGILM